MNFDHFFELCNRIGTNHNQRHDIGAVMLIMVFKKRLSQFLFVFYCLLVETFKVSSLESAEDTSFICQMGLFDLMNFSQLWWYIFLEFGVYCFYLTVCTVLTECRTLKKLWEKLQSAFQSLIFHIEIEKSWVLRGGCVSRPSIAGEIFRVFIFWSVLSSKEKHMFTEVCKAMILFWVVQGTWAHIHARSSEVGTLVIYQKDF